MAISFVGAGTQHSGLSTLSTPWPSGHAIDDFALLVLEQSGIDTTMSITGWTHITGSPDTDIADATGSRFSVFYRFADSAAMSNASATHSSDHNLSRMFVFRGVDVTTPLDATPTTDKKTTASTTATCPSITTTTANAWVVAIASRPDDSSSATVFGLPVNTNLTNLGDGGEGATATNDGGGFVLGYGTKVTAGASGTTTFSCPNVTNVTFTVALRESQISTTVIRPTSTTTAGGWTTGEASLHAALSDQSTSTIITGTAS